MGGIADSGLSLYLPVTGVGSNGGPLLLEAFAVEALRAWKDPARAWQGEVTFVFSGTQIDTLREERRAPFGKLPASWGDSWGGVEFGFVKVTYLAGARHMVIESRTVKPPRG